MNGNKRTAYVTALAFLELNGVSIERSSRQLEDATVDAVRGSASKQQISAILRRMATLAD